MRYVSGEFTGTASLPDDPKLSGRAKGLISKGRVFVPDASDYIECVATPNNMTSIVMGVDGTARVFKMNYARGSMPIPLPPTEVIDARNAGERVDYYRAAQRGAWFITSKDNKQRYLDKDGKKMSRQEADDIYVASQNQFPDQQSDRSFVPMDGADPYATIAEAVGTMKHQRVKEEIVVDAETMERLKTARLNPDLGEADLKPGDMVSMVANIEPALRGLFIDYLIKDEDLADTMRAVFKVPYDPRDAMIIAAVTGRDAAEVAGEMQDPVKCAELLKQYNPKSAELTKEQTSALAERTATLGSRMSTHAIAEIAALGMRSAALQDLKALGKDVLYALPKMLRAASVGNTSRMKAYFDNLADRAKSIKPGDHTGVLNLLAPETEIIGAAKINEILDSADPHAELLKMIEEKQEESEKLLYAAKHKRSMLADVAATPEINTDNPDLDTARSAGIRKLPRAMAEAAFLNALALPKGVMLAYDVINYSKDFLDEYDRLGTEEPGMSDMDRIIAAAAKVGIKITMDQLVNYLGELRKEKDIHLGDVGGGIDNEAL